jgi:hypothetical protein
LSATVVMPRLAIVRVGQAFLDPRGDLGVEHHAFLLAGFGQLQFPAASTFRRAALCRLDTAPPTRA